MTCPYCDSSDWDSESPFFRFEERSAGIWVYRNCTCQKCGKTFITREWYTTKDYDYECMSIEEFKERIGGMIPNCESIGNHSLINNYKYKLLLYRY